MLRVVVATAPTGGTGPLVRRLRDAGHEVVLVASADARVLAATALQEDADAVVLLEPEPGAPDVRTHLASAGADDVEVLDAGLGGDEVLAALGRLPGPR